MHGSAVVRRLCSCQQPVHTVHDKRSGPEAYLTHRSGLVAGAHALRERDKLGSMVPTRADCVVLCIKDKAMGACEYSRRLPSVHYQAI